MSFCPRCSDRALTLVVFLSRLIPFVSFDVVSYGAGLTKMTLQSYTLATLLGMIPLTFMYNYFGSALAIERRWGLWLGLAMVLLFFLLPRWIEKKNPLGLGTLLRHR
ncbi:MAG: TVP38/TMEM64 family protein [Deltaproteobacteria bacterium]|nr:TVP38/TMEM64 family protein [Deltaproteobacteria bacterium]